jgi:hypothetical protein
VRGLGDVPDRLIGNNNLTPVLGLSRNSSELRRNNLDRLIRLPLLQALTAAKHNAQATIERSHSLGRYEAIILL